MCHHFFVTTEHAGSRVRTLRTQQGMSLAALAAATNIDKSHLSKMERGERGLSLQQAVAIARALGVSSTAISGEDDPTTEPAS